jgi:light-regulated signal transduction histidine kinase (bacteriophytochrome)
MSPLIQDRGREETPVAIGYVARDLPAPRGDDPGLIEDAQRALLNILEDFAAERSGLESAQRAMLNILEDSSSEKVQLAAAERAVVNILDDFSEEKTRLEMVQRAVLNILEDLETERVKAELINRQLQKEIEVRKRAEEALKEYSSELARSNADLQQFAYVASHDLQEPLRAVSSFSQLLARRYRGKLDSDADDFITFMVEGATRMQTLINDLLTFSRIGTRGNPFAPVDCENILQTAKENLTVAIAESGAVITQDPLPALVADEIQLTQLFQNLFGNAIKFHRPEEAPRIHVSSKRQDGAWRLSVRDNGIGIDPQYFDRIFVIFQRLHGREKYSGTGIGLAICKKIVERHGGRIWVESEPGKGSTFHFVIPDERRNYDELSPTH